MQEKGDQPSRRRTGMALVAALGLMMLAAGLLAGTAVASVGLQRATHSLAAAARADSELRRALAMVLQGWDAGLDSLPVGAGVDRTTVAVAPAGTPVTVQTRVRRLGPALYAAVVAVQVGASAAPTASRRARLLLGRATDSSASGVVARVRPLSHWGVTDLP